MSGGRGRPYKPLILLSDQIRTPPISREARREIGFLIRMLQLGRRLEMPRSRPMPAIGRRCHELRVNDADKTWRVIYRTDPDAVVVVSLFSKKTSKTPRRLVDRARRLLHEYDDD